MSTDHYKKIIRVNATPTQAYLALTSGFSKWWTPCEGEFAKLGDRIIFKFPPQVSYWVFEATELIPDQYVELKCIQAHHIVLDKPSSSKTEWLNSVLRFKIKMDDNQTRIDFVHEGLTPDQHCYEVCEAGWDYFFLNSLKKFLNTGTGEPYVKPE